MMVWKRHCNSLQNMAIFGIYVGFLESVYQGFIKGLLLTNHPTNFSGYPSKHLSSLKLIGPFTVKLAGMKQLPPFKLLLVAVSQVTKYLPEI